LLSVFWQKLQLSTRRPVEILPAHQRNLTHTTFQSTKMSGWEVLEWS
jgi:hypothetical protein